MNCFRINLSCVSVFVFHYRTVYLCYVSYFVISVFPLCYCLVVSTSAIDCLERLVSEMTHCVLSGTLNHTNHTHFPQNKGGFR